MDNNDIYIKVYYQINSDDSEDEFMKYVSSFNPEFLSFSSFEFYIDPSKVELDLILDKFSSIIDVNHDSVIVLYSKGQEDYVIDLGIKMEIQYS